MTFRQRLLNHEPLVGTLTTIPHSAVQEMLASSGFDWMFIDSEHAPLTSADVALMVRSASCPTLVRIPDKSDLQAVRSALDCGATGIIAPLVNTEAETAKVVSAARYPPMGTRSVGVGRAHGYGPGFQNYMERANQESVVIVQIEHIDAVHRIDEIVSVPGLDCVFVGPYDLSGSLGKPGQVDDPEVVSAMDHVLEVCRDIGMPLGTFGITRDVVLGYFEKGFSLLALGMDTMFLAATAAKAYADLKSSVTSTR